MSGVALLSRPADGAVAPGPARNTLRAHWSLLPLGNALGLPIYASRPLERRDQAVEHAVIVIHGIARNAHEYFSRMMRAATLHGAVDRTLVIAPSFSIESDDRPHRLPGELHWRRQRNWKRGDRSSPTLHARLSAFAALDGLVAQLVRRDRFPRLTSVTIAGHSAGGHFVQRYACGHPPLRGAAHLRMRYVVANPGTYMYLDRRRPGERFDGTFTLPADPRADHYPYGLGALNRYMGDAGVDAIRQRARTREVVLLLGERDVDPMHESLDRSAHARLQGCHRLERGLAFQRYLDHCHAPHNTHTVRVAGVGHSSTRMFQSTAGRDVLFR